MLVLPELLILSYPCTHIHTHTSTHTRLDGLAFTTIPICAGLKGKHGKVIKYLLIMTLCNPINKVICSKHYKKIIKNCMAMQYRDQKSHEDPSTANTIFRYWNVCTTCFKTSNEGKLWGAYMKSTERLNTISWTFIFYIFSTFFIHESLKSWGHFTRLAGPVRF